MADDSGETVFLHPGELFSGRMPTRVKTILGSCVAITVRDRRLGLAAMAHCLLPEAGVDADTLPAPEAFRFVDTTIDLLLRAFSRQGARFGDLEIKLFGGADALNLDPQCPFGVGGRNVEAALDALAARGLAPKASGVGGTRGRAIEFDTGTGEVLVRLLPRESREEFR
ncbi:MAG TPA: chemotaxis protein CheD [Bryobacteraceae bacterium]|nr:chemotaxis protein CheD [Bryobacteraceae bacterium]